MGAGIGEDEGVWVGVGVGVGVGGGERPKSQGKRKLLHEVSKGVLFGMGRINEKEGRNKAKANFEAGQSGRNSESESQGNPRI